MVSRKELEGWVTLKSTSFLRMRKRGHAPDLMCKSVPSWAMSFFKQSLRNFLSSLAISKIIVHPALKLVDGFGNKPGFCLPLSGIGFRGINILEKS